MKQIPLNALMISHQLAKLSMLNIHVEETITAYCYRKILLL